MSIYTWFMKASDIALIYQDHHLLIVNKPAGVVIHPTYKNADGETLWDALLLYLAQQEGEQWQPPEFPDLPAWAGAPPHIRAMLREQRRERYWKEDGLLPRPCLLHRLDKDTSGVVALARYLAAVDAALVVDHVEEGHHGLAVHAIGRRRPTVGTGMADLDLGIGGAVVVFLLAPALRPRDARRGEDSSGRCAAHEGSPIGSHVSLPAGTLLVP